MIDLIAFERSIADAFNAGEIPYPVHLDGGNEAQLIDIFKDIDRADWVCGSWRMHYKCLLHGVPPETLRAAIIAGRSISLCFPEYRVVSSAIVGGILPIALGLAWQIKRQGGKERVHCFMGDMTALTGMALECDHYSSWHDLPIRWITEDNGKSVCTPTRDVWGGAFKGKVALPNRAYYRYDLTYPHSGAGVRVNF